MLTFDNEEELHKIKRNFPEAECVMRISTIATDARYNLSEKFGVLPEDGIELLKMAR
jgi:ornithine decarboxylase